MDRWRKLRGTVLLTWATLLLALTRGVVIKVTSPEVAIVGRNVSLSADFTSKQPPQVSWHADGKNFASWVVGQDSTLMVSEAIKDRLSINTSNASIGLLRTALSDSGNYTVTMTALDEQSDQKSIFLTVYELFSGVEVATPKGAVKEGSRTSTLTCVMTTGTWDVVSWTKDGRAITSDFHYVVSSNELVIQVVNRTDAGTYSCTVRNPFDHKTASGDLKVYYGPDVPTVGIVSATDLDPLRFVQLNASVNLTCATSSEPPAQYFWNVGDTQDTSVPDDPVLVFGRIGLEHAGVYTCIVVNQKTGRSVRGAVTVRVYELPPEMPSCSMVAIENNNALQFSCAWPGGFPNARIRWVGLSRNVSADSQLVQDEASPARLDGKNVTCVARHEVETKSCSIAPVSPIVVPSRLVAAETQGGATVTLRCRVTSNPSPVVRWYKEQRRLTSGSKFVIAASGTEMTIRNFTLGSDVGNYSCSCSNPLGVSARTLALTVPVISDMVVTRLNATTVVVSWAVRDSDIVTSFLVQLRAGAQRSLAKSSSSSSSSSSSDWRTERVAAMDDRSATVSRLWEEQGYSFRVVPVTGLAEGPPSEAQSVAPTVDRRLSIGAIAGIVVGCVAGALLMLLLVGCLLKRQYEKKKEAREKKQSPNGERVNQRNDQYANFQRAPYGMETGMPPRLDRPESSLHRSVSNKTDLTAQEWGGQSSTCPRTPYANEPFAFVNHKNLEHSRQERLSVNSELPHSSPAQPPIKSSTLARQKRLATMV